MNETLNAGKYFLGDPFPVLHPKIYIGIWENVYNYANGKFTINDFDFAVHNTHYGDGIFYDTKKRKYKVDSGTIALIHCDLIEDLSLCKNNGYIFEFNKEINFIYDAGLFIIKSGKKYIQIDTRIMEEYNSDIEDSFLDDEKEHISNKIIDDSDDDFIMEENDLDSNGDDEDNNEESEIVAGNSKKLFKFFK